MDNFMFNTFFNNTYFHPADPNIDFLFWLMYIIMFFLCAFLGLSHGYGIINVPKFKNLVLCILGYGIFGFIGMHWFITSLAISQDHNKKPKLVIIHNYFDSE